VKLEPVGGTAPTFSGKSSLSRYDWAAKSSLALPCPAQAFPPPQFRLLNIFIYEPKHL